MSLSPVHLDLFIGGIGGFECIGGLILIAIGLNGAPLHRAPAILWRDPSAVAGLILLGCGSFLLLNSAASNVPTFVPAGLVSALAVLGDMAMVGGVVALIRGLLLYRSWRREITRRERRKNV
jgi:hypothetical protein